MKMKIVSVIIFVLAVAFGSTATESHKQQAAPTECCQMVRQALAAAQAIKPGMTRREVEKKFRPQGGLIFPDETTYGYDDCELIKIDLDFKVVDPGANGLNPSDTVIKISKPYLADSAAD